MNSIILELFKGIQEILNSNDALAQRSRQLEAELQDLEKRAKEGKKDASKRLKQK